MTEALRALSRNLGAASGDAMTQKANSVVLAAGQAVAAQARQNAPKRTGRLAESIQVQTLSRDTVKVIATAPYSQDVERGTRPHTISPRNAKVLAFRVGGRMVFARAVRHPGTKAEPFLQPAIQTGLTDAAEQLGKLGVSLVLSGETRL